MTGIIANFISLFVHFTRQRNWNLKRQFSGIVDVHWKLPLPKTVHLKLTLDVIGKRKLLFIGDVHGCADELNDLLEKVEEKYNNFEILPIFVGDLVNKGPKNIETLQKVRQLDHFAVRGNHDESTLRHAIKYKQDNSYKPPPRYMPWVSHLSDEDVLYLQDLPYTISIPSFNSIVVHAGLVPNVALEKQNFSDMIIMRNLITLDDGSHKSAELPGKGQPWASLWPGPVHCYFGHDAIRKMQNYPFATGLDTGCVYGFQLTALLLSEDGSKEIFTVRAKDVYEKPSSSTNKAPV